MISDKELQKISNSFNSIIQLISMAGGVGEQVDLWLLSSQLADLGESVHSTIEELRGEVERLKTSEIFKCSLAQEEIINDLRAEVERLKDQRNRVTNAWNESLSTLSSFVSTIESLRAEVERYRTALKFYASELTYDIDHLSKHGYIIIDRDNGERARKALGDSHDNT